MLRLESLEERQMLTVNLGLGDMAITGYASDADDTVSLALLKDVDSGTQFTVTDNGWFGAQTGLRSGEGTLTLTFNSTVSAGTQISLNFTDGLYSHGLTATGSVPNLSADGDSLLVFNGSIAPTSGTAASWITGISMNGSSAWDADATSAQTSAKPTAFTDGDTSFAGFTPEVDNAVLNNLGNVVGSATAIRAEVYDAANWTTNDTTPPTIPGTTAFFTTIQAGIDGVTAGSTVKVLSGTYAELVSVNKTVSLLGAQSGVDGRDSGRTVPANESIMAGAGLGALFNISANDVVIDGFTIEGQSFFTPGAGIIMGPSTSGTEVRNNIIQNNMVGVYVANNSSTNAAVIERNLFQNNTNAGPASGHSIYADQFTSGVGMQNVLIDNNRFTNSSLVVDTWTLGISNSHATAFEDITFSNNEVTNHGRGIYFFNTDGISVSDNTISGTSNYAIGLFGDFGDNVDATISGNTLSGNNRGIYVDGYEGELTISDNQITGGNIGLDINDADITRVNLTDLTLSGNTTGGTISGVGTVSLTTGSGNDVFQATATSLAATGDANVQSITLSGVANIEVHGDGGSDELEISGTFGTIVYDYTNANDGSIDLGGGVSLAYTGLEPITNTGTASDVIFNLTGIADDAILESDGLGGLRLRSANGTFETTDFSFPTNSLTINGGAGDSLTITEGVTVSGSITLNVPIVSLDANLTAPTITGTATTVNVLSNAASIQDGISVAAAGATVNVAAGTYALTGDIALDKSLTIRGPNAAISPVDGVRVAEAIIDGGNVGPFDGSGFSFNTASGITSLTVEGLTFTNFDGNLFESSLVPVTNVNLHKNIFDGNNGGLFYKFDTSVATEFDVQDNLIANHAMTGANTALFFLGNVANSSFNSNKATNVAQRELFNIYHSLTNSSFNDNELANTAHLVGMNANANNVQVNYNKFNSITGGALYVSTYIGQAVSDVEIKNNVILNTTGIGIHLITANNPSPPAVASISNVEIDGNIISGTGTYGLAIDTTTDDDGTISNISVTNNTFTNNAFGPILAYSRVNPVDGLNTVQNLTIDDNTFNVDASIYGDSFYLIDMRNVGGVNSFSGNEVTFAGALPGGTDAIRAIALRGSRTGTWNVTNNELDGGGVLHNNAPTVYVSGIAILSEDATTGNLPSTAVINITGNVITGFEDAIVVRDGVAPTDYGNLAAGLTMNVHNNDLSGNSQFALRTGTDGATIDASSNYWGTSDPTVVAAMIAGSSAVDFSALLDNDESVANQSVIGFQADLSSVTVHEEGTQIGPAGRINEGISLVDAGGTVNILSGTYAESVDATTKSATLSPGASPGLVTVSDLTLDGDDTLAIEINGLTPGTQHDQFVVTGTATLGGAAASVTGNYIPAVGDEFTIIDAATVLGALSTTTVSLNNIPLTVTYPGGGNVVLEVAAPPEAWVDNDWEITTDIGPLGLSAGDIVESDADGGDALVSGKIFGYDAFAAIADAVAAVADGISSVVHVLAGTFVESLSIAKDVTIEGQDDALTHIDANSAITGILVNSGQTVAISGISLSNFSSTGIRVQGDLTLADSTVSDGFVGVWADGGALDMSSTSVEDFQIFGVQVSGATADVTVDASEISGVPTSAAAVVVSAGQADITGSILSGSQRGLLVNATGTASIHGSDLSSLGLRGVENATATIVDASGNWWGSASQLDVQAETLGSVDFTPYLDTDTDTDSGARGFAGDFSHLHVTALGGQSGSVGRIKEAVGLIADGSLTGANRLVEVHSGNYVENSQIFIDKDLTVTGDAAKPVITPGQNFTGDNASGAWMLVDEGTTFNLNSVVLDGNGFFVWQGLRSHGNTTIDGVDFRDIQGSASGSPYRGAAVQSFGGIVGGGAGADSHGGLGGSASHLVVENSTFEDIGRIGVLVKGTQATADIEGNVYTGKGSGDWLDYAFEVGAGAKVDIIDNTVSDNLGVASDSSTSAGVLVTTFWGAGTEAHLSGNNQFSGNTVGVHVGFGITDTSVVTITGGTINSNDSAGVHVGGTADVEIHGTTILANGVGVRAVDGATLLIDSNTDIEANVTGILVASGAGATITGNAASISGNTIGIDVDGGSATISGNAIYDNTTGIRLTGGGTASIDNNVFEGGADPDNGTDLRVDASAGAITGGVLTGNTFAGSTYYIDNQSAQDITALRDPYGTNFYNVAGVATTDDFVIEGRIYHEVDNAASGLVTWVPNTVFVTPVTTATASDNDYTRIKNAIEAAGSGTTIVLGMNALDGVFNWDEPFALASWALGNDGTASTDDDWSVLLGDNQIDVTVTADLVDGITIQGPGDVDGANLEGVFVAFDNGTNTGWTFENFNILDVDNAIGFYYAGDDFSDLTIQNMHIRVAADKAVGSGGDANQNIGIHYGFGQNITIANNIIDVIGTGDGSTVGIQSNTHNFAAYDGLLIDNNTINVLNAGPETILGIWENGHTHTSNITISNNDFVNLDPLNDPTTNLQRAFRVTSHSSGSTTVTYSGNTVAGANIGFQWLAGQNFTGNQAVAVTGNILTDVNTGFLVQSNGLADFSGNSLTNSGAMEGVGIGIDVAAGSIVSVDGSPSENAVVGFATGIRSAGTLTVEDNDASIHGNVTGIDVVGGSATITGNHIYDNTTGIRFTGSGGGSVTNNNFDGGGSDDNTTDLKLESSAGVVTIGANNSFAGDLFFIDNETTQSYDLSSNGTTFDEANNFRIEDKMHHRMDTDLAIGNGRITWVAGNLYVTTPGGGSTDSDIQRGVDSADAGNTVNVEAGTYVGNLAINKNLTLISESGRASTTIEGVSGVGALGAIHLSGTTTDVNIGGLTGNGFTIEGIDNGLPGIENGAVYISGTHSGTDVRWNEIVAMGDHGLVAESAAIVSGTVIDNNIFSGQTFIGPNPAGAGFGAQFSLANVPRQLFVMSGVATKSNITFSNNDLVGVSGGISLTDDTGAPVAAHEQGNTLVTLDAATTSIFGNTFLGTSTAGAQSLRARGTTNTIVDNIFNSSTMGSLTVDLLVTNTGNVIQGNTFGSSAGFAISVSGGSSTIGGSDAGADNTIAGYGVGVLITGAATSVILDSNSITGNSLAGVYINSAGKVLAETNTLTGNLVGIHVEGGAIVDAGSDNGLDGDPTGLGNSAGGNILTGYTGTGGNYAIEDLNLAAQSDVYARFNDFGPYVNISIIENYVFDDTDDPTRSTVIFDGALNLQTATTPVFVDDDWAGTALGVDADGAGGASLGNGTAFGVDQFATIEDALAAVAVSGQVLVYNGEYFTSGYIVDQAVSIEGESRSGVVVAPLAEDSHEDDSFMGVSVQQAFIVSASDVTIKTLTIDGDANLSLTGSNNFRGGIITPDDSNSLSNLLFTDLDVKNIYRRGIQISWSGDNNEISDSLIEQDGGALSSGGAAVAVFGGLAGSATATRVLDNTITNSDAAGVISNFGALLDVRGNTITSTPIGMNLAALDGGSVIGGPNAADKNTIDMTGLASDDVAILVTFTGDSPFAPGVVTVQGNEIIASGGDAGIWAFRSGPAPLRIVGNQFTSTGSTSASTGEGAAIFITDDDEFFGESSTDNDANVEIQGNTIDGFHYGVHVRAVDDEGSAETLSVLIGGPNASDNNDITGSGGIGSAGVFIEDNVNPSSADVTVEGNNLSISGFAVGIDVQGGLATINGNKIHDNGIGVRVNDATATLDGNSIHDNDHGIWVEGTSTFDMTDGSVDDNTFNGLFVTGDGSVQAITVDGTTFSGNASGQVNVGDITLFNFSAAVGTPSTASFTDVVVTSNNSDFGIQIRGTAGTLPVLDGSTTAEVSFDNVTILGTQQDQAMLIQQYADLSGFSFNDVEFNSVAAGGLVLFDTDGTLDLGNSVFHDTYTAGDGPGNGTGFDIATSLTDIDATDVTFVGADKSTLAGNFAIEDRVGHYLDADVPGPLTAGFVDWIDDSVVSPYAKAVFVTQESYAPLAGTVTPSIQRGIDAALATYNVYVQGGSYTYAENLTIDKGLSLIGEPGKTPNVQPGAAGDLITINGAGLDGDDTVSIDNFNFDGLAGLGDRGIRVPDASNLSELIVKNSSFTGFDFNAIILAGNGGASMVDNVTLDNLNFSNNGIAGGNGSGDIQLFDFNGNALLKDLTHVGSSSGTTGAHLAIQLNGSGIASAGTVEFDNVDISGKYVRQFIGIQQYSDISDFTFNDVKLGGATSEITGTFGAGLRIDTVGSDSVTGPASVDLGNTHFRGLAGTSTQRHEIEFAPDNLTQFQRLDATGTTWTVGGNDIAAADLSLSEAFAVEDRILHYVDMLHPTHGGAFGPYKGFVDVQASKAFITDELAPLGLIGDGSISRGVDVVALGGTVHVEDGTYFEDVVVDRGVTVLGDSLPTIHAVNDNDNSSVVLEVRADNVTIEGLDIVVDRDDASGGIAASNVAQADVNMAGGSFANLVLRDNIVTSVGENNLGSFNLHTGLPGTTMGIALVGIGGTAHSVTLQGNQVLADLGSAPLTGGPSAASVFTRGIYLGALQATVGGSGVGEGNTSTGLAQDLLVQFASNGLTTIEGNTFLVTGVDISSPNSSSPVDIIGNTFAPADLDSFPGFPLQSLLIRNFSDHPTSPITIDGNIFDDFNIGIDVEAGSATITGNTFANVDDGGGDTIGDSAIGIRVRSGATADITGDNDITGTSTAIHVLGSAFIVGNDDSINGNGTGIDVDGGAALVQDNDLNGNTIGVLIRNGGIADLGQNGPGTNFTGLGISNGGNDFSGYTSTATVSSGAIVNLNGNGANANPGPQGVPPDVPAFGNIWNDPTSAGIENVIWHDFDDNAVGFVDYETLANLVVSLDVLPTITTNEDISEGGSVTVYGQFVNDAQAHTVTIDWGDGSPDTVLNLSAGVFTFSATSPLATYVDDPDGAIQTILRGITVTVEEDANPGNFLTDTSLSVDVSNVVPIVSLVDQDGDDTINEGETFNLVVGPRFDPGADTITAYTIFWGDGDSTFVSGDPLTSAAFHSHLYADGVIPPTRTITIDVLDDDGTWIVAGSLEITVNNVPPTAVNFQVFNSTVNEGSTTTVFFSGPFTDPGSPDSPFHFAYDFNGNGIYGEAGEIGDGTYAGSVVSTSAVVPAAFLADDDDSPRTVKARIIDNDGGFSEYMVAIDILNVAPVVNAGADDTALAGVPFNHSVSFTDPGADANWTVNVDWNGDGDFLDSGEAAFGVPGHVFNINHTYGLADIGNTYNVEVRVDDNDGGAHSDFFQVTVEEDTLRVIDFEVFASGFDVTFNRALALADLNLYDGNDLSVDLPDLTVVGTSLGQIDGSMVWDADTNTLTWVKTGGVLAADTYTVTLLSSNVAFEDALGNVLDGDGDFDDSEVNDDYVDGFVVTASGDRVVRLPDFARGAGQDVHVPPSEMGGLHVPISIDNAAGVLSVDVDVAYDPALLNITGASLGAGPVGVGGWSITTNPISPGLLKITISGTTALSGSNVELIRLNSDVPNSAPYADSQVIRLLNLEVNESVIAAKADYAIHKAAYLSDADGDGEYLGNDAGLISRVVVNLDSGFDAHDWTDPVIVADNTGNGALSGQDASNVAQEAAFIDVSEIPPLPIIGPLVAGTPGIDPELSVPNVLAAPGDEVTVPVVITVLPGEAADPTVISATFDVFFNNGQVAITTGDIAQGTFWDAGDGWSLTKNVVGGQARLVFFNSEPSQVGTGDIAYLTFTLDSGLTPGDVVELDIEPANANEGNLTWTNVDGSIGVTYTADFEPDGDVDDDDLAIWEGGYGIETGAEVQDGDVDRDGDVDGLDFLAWQVQFGSSLYAFATSITEPTSLMSDISASSKLVTDSYFAPSVQSVPSSIAASASTAEAVQFRSQRSAWIRDLSLTLHSERQLRDEASGLNHVDSAFQSLVEDGAEEHVLRRTELGFGSRESRLELASNATNEESDDLVCEFDHADEFDGAFAEWV